MQRSEHLAPRTHAPPRAPHADCAARAGPGLRFEAYAPAPSPAAASTPSAPAHPRAPAHAPAAPGPSPAAAHTPTLRAATDGRQRWGPPRTPGTGEAGQQQQQQQGGGGGDFLSGLVDAAASSVASPAPAAPPPMSERDRLAASLFGGGGRGGAAPQHAPQPAPQQDLLMLMDDDDGPGGAAPARVAPAAQPQPPLDLLMMQLDVGPAPSHEAAPAPPDLMGGDWGAFHAGQQAPQAQQGQHGTLEGLVAGGGLGVPSSGPAGGAARAGRPMGGQQAMRGGVAGKGQKASSDPFADLALL